MMTEESPESPLRPPSKDKADRGRLDGVVDELKSVLAGLGNDPEPTADPVEPANGTVEEPAFRDESAPDALKNSAPLSSDADFWNGNVLGWPGPGAMDFPDTPKNGAAPPSGNPFLDDPVDSAGPAFSQPAPVKPVADAPALPPASSAEPASPEPDVNPFDPFLSSTAQRAPAPVDLNKPIPPVPEPARPPEPVSSAPAEAAINPFDPFALPPAAQPAPDPIDLRRPPPVEVPPAAPPVSQKPEAEPETPWDLLRPTDAPVTLGAVSNGPMLGDVPEPPASPLEPGFSESEPVPAVEAPVPTAPVEEPPVPIPVTIHKRPAPATDEAKLDLETTEAKPSNLVQIACLFPEGHEKEGQQFVMKLREASEKSGGADYQAVFVTSWTPDNLDVAAWKRSATLSGADVLFVLAPRQQSNLFSALRGAVGDPLRTRLVFLEQVAMRTLYADILVQLKRAT